MFNIESRTLYCTSTGGPATYVTWKKAGKVITLNTTYKQTQRITDLVTGTYQTVLSIAPEGTDINDTYSCMVNNTRGFSTAITEITSEDLLLSCFQAQYLIIVWSCQLLNFVKMKHIFSIPRESGILNLEVFVIP